MLQQQVTDVLIESTNFIFVPTTEQEYEQLVNLLDELVDVVRGDESHPLAKMMDVVGVLVENYENEHIPQPGADPIAVLRYFMKEYGLKQSDLPELGSQGVVSEILHGKRTLNLRQLKALSRRFNVPVTMFIADEPAQPPQNLSRRAA